MPATGSTRKRSRYIEQACDRCKASKVRCNGEVPCAYCLPRDANGCRYRTARFPVHLGSNEDKDMATISAQLQWQTDKLDYLIQQVVVLQESRKDRHHQQSQVKKRTRLLPKKPLPLFQGSTSSFFCIGILDTTLEALEPEARGATIQSNYYPSPACPSFSILQGEIIRGEPSETESSESEHTKVSSSPTTLDPLEELDGDCVIRLIQVYQDMVGFMFPIVDISHLLQQAENCTKWPGAGPGHQLVGANDMVILKMVIAIAMTAEPRGYSDLGSSLYQSLQEDVEAMLWHTQLDLEGLILLVLVSLFHFYRSRWRLAWRMISNITRVILELGLNQQVVFDHAFSDPGDRSLALNAIWSTFVLDKHLSYSLGLSMAMRDLHLDPGFTDPVNAPYLKAMIEYSAIGAAACDLLLSDNCKWEDRFAFFQYRLEQWDQRIDGEFQFARKDDKTDQANRMLRTILHLRANHLRILIARSFLCANLRTVAPIDIWSTSVDVAVSTVNVLVNLDSSNQTYRFQQTQFDCFLVSALGILLLAVVQETSKKNSPSSNGQPLPVPPATAIKARRSAMAAINLLHSQADSSFHSQRLWEHVRNLAQRLNLFSWLSPKDPPGLTPAAVMEAPAMSITNSVSAQVLQTMPVDLNWYENIRVLGLEEGFLPSTEINQDLGLLFDNNFFSTSGI